MIGKSKKKTSMLLATVFGILLTAGAVLGQTGSFTYQGRLTDGGSAANGNYDLQFALFDSLSGGAQVGPTQTINTVAVSNGVFTVSLDFGTNAFPGASRFLEISVRLSGAGAFTLLTPRQPITSTPYAVRSLNAATADSVPASGVPAGSGNYIQNSSSSQTANFSISGNGIAAGTLSGGVVNATTQYNLNGLRILSAAGTDNLFAGAGSGSANTGSQNSFFGAGAGAANSSASGNSFFGFRAGAANTGGGGNAFFGNLAGRANTTGGNNNFFGISTGETNTTGTGNAFFGNLAGQANTTGGGNAFFGRLSGLGNTTGNFNTLIGQGSDVGVGDLTNATAIGTRARVDQSNSLVLGSINGINGATASTNVGIGTTAPDARLSVIATGDGARVLHLGTERGWVFKQLGTGASTALELTGNDPNNNNKNFVINTAGNVGIGTTVPQAKLDVRGSFLTIGNSTLFSPNSLPAVEVNGGAKFVNGTVELFSEVKVHNLGVGGTALCRNSSDSLTTCSSSLRYKKDVSRFGSGLEIINHLRPIAFTWKQDGIRDIGLAAEEVEKVEPLLTFRNNKNEIEGVKYDQLSAVIINAIQEQQAQIKQQTALIEQQQKQIVRLKKLVCRSHRRNAVCK